MRLFRRMAGACLVALALVLSAPAAHAFSVVFSWCPNAGSPAFALKDVPAGTVKLDFHMTDLDKPSFHHGGGTVGYRGQAEVACNAFSDGFVGPSPPPGEAHSYEFTIRALASDGKVLATTTARRRFPD